MLKNYNTRLFRYGGILLCTLIWLANNTNPPNGRTGAPFDGECNDCHAGGSFSANAALSGLPSTIEPNTTYNLTLTVTPSGGNPVKGGYQLVVVANNNSNCGNLTATNAESGTELFGGREYIDHRGGKLFGGNPVSWEFDWTSPATVNGNLVKFYFISNLTNNNGNNTGDNAIPFLETYNFSGPPPVTATITDISNLLCNGVNTGSATVEGNGGVPPYTYLWSNGQNQATAVNLPAGTFTVTVTGSGGSGSATATAVVTQPPAITLSASVSGTLTCIVTSVTGTATAAGGTGAFGYEWSNGDFGNQATFFSSGTYFVTATDANGCTKTTSVNVTSNTQPPIAVVQAGGSVSCQQPTTILSGAGSSTGPNFTYLWTTDNGNIVSGANTLNCVVNAPGTYTLTVTNTNNGCTAEASTTVTGDVQPPVVTTSGGQLTCTTTSVTISANANEPATYAWSGPNNFSSNLQNPVVSTAGTYTVTVTASDNGCSAVATATVTSNTTPPVVSASGGTLTCIATSVTLSVTATPTSTVNWVGPNNFMSNQQNPVVTVPGVYTVTATATGNGCTASATATVLQNITPPQLSVTNGLLTCANTTDTLSASSPDTTATFAWTGPNNFSFNGPNPVVSLPGTYTVTVTSAVNGCTSTTTSTVTQNITPPAASAVSPEEITCAEPVIQLDGTASSQGSGFSYFWSTTNGNIVSGATTLTPTVNATGNYNLLVTNNNNGCTSSTSVLVTQDPALGVQTNSITQVSCFGGNNGAISITASGGDGQYSYLWSNGDTLSTASGLSAGTYSVTVSDNSGCSAALSAIVTEPGALAANASATGESALGANDGTATAVPTGGILPYTYVWSNDSTSQTITGLAPGPYTVTVTDDNNCTAVQTVTVNSFNCTLTSSVSTTNVSCNGGSNGSASVSVNGAAQPVEYQWSNGDTTAMVTNLVAGTYTVSITDANNCPALHTVVISQPPVLNANATATPETALGANDGTATAAPTGGTSPYQYLWSNGATTPAITGLAPGLYTVTVTDGNGCTKQQTVQVLSFNCQLVPAITIANVSCNGGNNGQATVTISGGTLPFSYNWTNGDTTATASNLAAGVYTVTVEDANGCTVFATAQISQPAPLEIDTIVVSNVACPESTNGAASISVIGGTAPYMFSAPLVNLPVGNYSVVVTDSNGCTLTAGFQIISTDQTPPQINCPGPELVACAGTPFSFGVPVVSDNCALNNTQPVLVSGLPSGSVFPAGTTFQLFKITDVSGNTDSCSFIITVHPQPLIAIDTVIHDVNNSGKGSIEVSISGGSGGPYTFEWTGPEGFMASKEDISGLLMGAYVLSITDTFGCITHSDTVLVDNTTGSSDVNPEYAFLRVIPNPAVSHIRLEISGKFVLEHVLIFDRYGRMLKILPAETASGDIEISGLPDGLYFLQAWDDSGSVRVARWIKSGD